MAGMFARQGAPPFDSGLVSECPVIQAQPPGEGTGHNAIARQVLFSLDFEF